ncbi:MAG TPA: thioredoxin [Candidatus Omnitrophota bacterium]|nr:thioredoxin [Candidatus Omnitrophota bacterium]
MGHEKVLTDASFETDVLKSTQPVVVDFWAEWCGPCRMLGPVVEKIAQANEGKVVVGKMNVDENPLTPGKFGIQGIPTLLFFKNGEKVGSIVGFNPQEKIQAKITELFGV